MEAWAHHTLHPPCVVSHGCQGSFTPDGESVALGHGTWLELCALQGNGALATICSQPVKANIVDLQPLPSRALPPELAAQVGASRGCFRHARGQREGACAHRVTRQRAQVAARDVLLLLTDAGLLVWMGYRALSNR